MKLIKERDALSLLKLIAQGEEDIRNGSYAEQTRFFHLFEKQYFRKKIFVQPSNNRS